jgi:hypothetical protein
MVMIIALFMVVIVLLVALAILTNASYSASDALGVQTKNQTFDAAEAGLNVAMWQIDQDNFTPAGVPTTCSAPVNGYTCTWDVVYNGLYGGGATVTDPVGNSVTVGPRQALLAGWASSILGGRTVYVEQIVAPGPPIQLPKGAIVCGQNGVVNHQQITDISGKHSADIRCGSITASGGGQTPDGNSYASGATNQITGLDGQAHTNVTPPVFLTAGQLAALQRSTAIQAQSGPPNFYAAGNVSGGTIGASGANCVAFIGGDITLGGSANLTNYCATTVVMGTIVVSGNATYQALPAATSHIIYVFGTTTLVLQGTPTTSGTIYAANADITVNGSGNGNFTGAVISPHNVSWNGGGNATFNYDGSQLPPPAPNPLVIPQSQWEY